jgi:hypothetical protein
MKALEFRSVLNPDNTLTVPPEIVAQVSSEQELHVILVAGDSVDNQDWAALSTDQFFKGYADSDAIYDDLPTR